MLVIQGSGLSGPIPPGIASLTKLSDLRISDLNGTEAKFPPLDNVKNLTILILRSCNIVGAIPPYLGTMPYLKTLDLSFNKLNGEIPSSFASQSKTKYLYLTGNLLSRCGSLCDSRPNDRRNIDLSYNNFSSYNKFSSIFQSCQQNVNLFDSSVKDNRLGVVSCLGSFYCPRTWDSLHINCGGGNVTHDGITYEEDSDPGGPSKFYNGGPNWAFSSTGHFLDNKSAESFIFRSSTSLPINTSSLNMEARGSPLSLTYYAFCLINGNYTVKLHFTEVVFTDDKTYYSLGRRIFDVHVQGTRVLKDFNIENAAGGVRKEIIKNFTAIVTNGTLEIRFYWAGKGTTSLPDKGVYGPLISAISVKSDPVPPSDGKLSMGVLAGIVAAVVSSIILLLGILWWFCFLRPKYTMKQDLKGLDLQTGSFTLRQIRAATNNFDTANKIGEGGFGSVYKGLLSDGTLIAVKQLSSKSKQGNREFVNEIGMISALQHPHLVKLYGCCIDGNQLLLVYEYMENNSLSRALFGPEECQLNLDWSTRYKICIGIARGLSYLHEESRLKIVHRDIKASNVLLDKDLNPKISDFGLAKLDDEENTHISTRIAGTYGYMAPEYAMHGYLTYKADVYSFGIVALEIVSGRCNASNRTKENSFYILDWAHDLKKKGNLMELVDPRLGSDFDREEVMVMINVALLCTDVLLAVRPAMSSVVSMLEGRMVLHELISEPTVSSTGIKPESIEENRNDRQIPSVSVDRPLTASSASAGDLYPVNLDSAYLLKRE
ncbi:Non-specific serine/threonine protein kinase [Bertholletia excelsa]